MVLNERLFLAQVFEAGIFFSSLVLTLVGVGYFRRWSLNGRLLDVPNERSSHISPVPRGGGLIIAAICLAGFALAYWQTGHYPYLVFLAGGGLLATAGWLDDLYSLPISVKFTVQTLAALFLIWALGFFDYVLIGGMQFFLGMAGIVVTLAWFIWVVNAFNLMDGIDGIAGTQALIAAAAWGVFGLITGSAAILFAAAMTAGSSLGFLYHNWQPARIFLGDVGSTFLGFIFAALPLMALYESGAERGFVPLFAAAVIWPFIFDTVFTFVRRLATVGTRAIYPHRTHIYQLLAIAGWRHSRIAAIYGMAALLLTAAAVVSLKWQSAWPVLLPVFFIAASAGMACIYFIFAKREGGRG